MEAYPPTTHKELHLPFYTFSLFLLTELHHSALPAQCHLWGRCLLVLFFTLKNWQPKHPAQETNILLEKKIPNVQSTATKARRSKQSPSSVARAKVPALATVQPSAAHSLV